MHDVNDFKLVSLAALVHDEALFHDYRAFVQEMADIYAHQEEIVLGKVQEQDGFVFETELMQPEVSYWRHYAGFAQPQSFLNWMKSSNGFGSRDERDTHETYKFYAQALVHKRSGLIVGRYNLLTGIDRGVWTGMGFDCVRPDCRGQGIGHIIMAHKLDHARRVGVEKVKINISEDNIASLKRLERLDEAGLMFDHKFVQGRKIAWIKPDLGLEKLHAILKKRSAPAPQSMPDIGF